MEGALEEAGVQRQRRPGRSENFSPSESHQFRERLRNSQRVGNPWDQTNLVQLSRDWEASDVIFFLHGLIKSTL